MLLTCEVCQKVFTSGSVLYRHIREVHQIKQRFFQVHNFNYYNNKCFTCHTSFKYVKDLRDHLVQRHDFISEEEELKFKSFAEFESWLEQICKRDKVQYNLTRGSKKVNLKGTKVNFYSCNRSIRNINKVPEKQRKRTTKTQGSRKLDYACTSQIKLTEVQGFYIVTYYKSHYRHEKDLKHLSIPKSDKHEIVKKLLAGIPTSEFVFCFCFHCLLIN